MIFHCYDTTSRGHLTIPEIKTMFIENFVEGGCAMGHRMVEYLMEAALAATQPHGSLLSYPQLLEVAMYHPEFFCHLIKSRIPPDTSPPLPETSWRRVLDACLDQSGRLLMGSMLFMVLLTVFAIGLYHHAQDDMTEALGWTHIIGGACSGVFKILMSFLALTLCSFTPFLYRKLPRPFHVQESDIRVFRSVILSVILLVVAVHAMCQTLSMGRIATTHAFQDPASELYTRSQPSFQSLMASQVFITGLLLFTIVALAISCALLEDFNWTFNFAQLKRLRMLVYGNETAKVLCLTFCGVLLALHASTTFVRSCFQLPCLFWLWLGFPLLALVLDYAIFKLLDPVSHVDVVDYRILPRKGVLLTLSKPVDCRLGAVSFVSVRFPRSPVHASRSLAVLSHPSENHLTVLVQGKSAWCTELLSHLSTLSRKEETLEEQDSGHSAAVEVHDSGATEEATRPVAEQVSPNRARYHHPERLTRLNTRVVYLTQTQRLIRSIGDDPQALATERPPPPETIQPSGPRRSTGNFNVIFEITPASLSTEDSIRREEQRVTSRQVTDESLAVPIDSSRLSVASNSSTPIGLCASLRGPYKLNNAFQEEKLWIMLSYPVLLFVGHNLGSLPLIPVCHYLLRRKTPGYRERVPTVTTHRIVLTWQVESFEDALWLLELLEPLYELHSLIRLEVRLHLSYQQNSTSPSVQFYDAMERITHDAEMPKLLIETRSAVFIGQRDWEYELTTLQSQMDDARAGVLFDGPQATLRQMHTWISAQAVDQFDFLSLGNISV